MVEISLAGAGLAAWFKANWLMVILLAGILGAFIFLRTQPSPIGSVAEFNASLATGQPTIVEFYSNF